AYVSAGQSAAAVKLGQELLADARKSVPPGSPQIAGLLGHLGLALLQLKACPDAEAVLCECLAIREKRQPDAWTTFNTKSLLGGPLLGQQKYADAEPLLLQGYEGMKQRADKIPKEAKSRLNEAIDRLVQLYDAWGKPVDAEKWRLQLEEASGRQP